MRLVGWKEEREGGGKGTRIDYRARGWRGGLENSKEVCIGWVGLEVDIWCFFVSIAGIRLPKVIGTRRGMWCYQDRLVARYTRTQTIHSFTNEEKRNILSTPPMDQRDSCGGLLQRSFPWMLDK